MNESTLSRGRSAAPRVLRVQPDAELRRPVLVGRTIAKVERDLILCTLEHCRGNRTHAASILGISVRTLRNKLLKYATNVPPGACRGISDDSPAVSSSTRVTGSDAAPSAGREGSRTHPRFRETI
jgi:hypothetical protein